MNRKIYRAPNIQQAIENIKQELGSDAMILSTRKVTKKPMDPYAKPMFEVEASVPEEGGAARRKHRKRFGADSGSAGSRNYGDDGKTMTTAIQDDIAQIKDMISIAGFSSGMPNMVCNHFESVGILASLLRTGISERMANYIIQQASSIMDKNARSGEKIKSLKKFVMRQCMDLIDTKEVFRRNHRTGVPQAAAFVGPTGVGKTTTIAKLAALMTFEKKMKVGLISIDNYRVGAFEQLKAYASIMGLLCVPAYSSEDFIGALDRMRGMDIILIDTAGHSHLDRSKIEEILQLIQTDFAISTHLVLSVTSESTIMSEASSAFLTFKPETLIFTKIDETRRCGKIMDQVCDSKLPVSLITNGQRVPEDLIVPDKTALLKIILGKGNKGETNS